MDISDIATVIAAPINSYRLTAKQQLLEPVCLQYDNMTTRQRRRHEATRKKKGRK